MECLKAILVLALVMALATTLLASSIDQDGEETLIDEDENEDFDSDPATEKFYSLRGASRFLAQSPSKAKMTCNKYPRVCRAKGSPGPDCCKKKCVNVTTDRHNCGMCGKKCKHTEICCKGACVNPNSNKKHCGGCNKKCQKGDVCSLGMCNYA